MPRLYSVQKTHNAVESCQQGLKKLTVVLLLLLYYYLRHPAVDSKGARRRDVTNSPAGGLAQG